MLSPSSRLVALFWGIAFLAIAASGSSFSPESSSPQHHSSPSFFSKVKSKKGEKKDLLSLLKGKIKHVIVLMMENRSFDHFFGWGKQAGLRVDGLTGKESNPLNDSDSKSRRIAVNKDAPFINACDPDHSTPATSSKIFGQQKAKSGDFSHPTMEGFVSYEYDRHQHNLSTDFCDVVSMFTPDRLPVITALAQEFALFDRFFCSHPGPTWPNRMYALSATTLGSTETGPWFRNIPGQLFPQPTIFDQVAHANLTWRNYYNDTPWELFLESVAHSPDNTRPLSDFFEDAASGSLPNFAWINPLLGINVTTGIGSNDQHPDHDVRAGEQLYKAIYESLRASPAWNDTLFVLTFDEHGGFYDHVDPPLGVPSPEYPPTLSYPDKGFTWDRLGVRIPTLLASPWIKKGTIISEPPLKQQPQPGSSQYELTSIMHTARLLLGIPNVPLTRRDAWSATFEHVFEELESPRVDCPMHLPDAIPPSPKHLKDEASLPLNDLQEHVLTVHGHLAGLASDGSAHKQEGVKLQQHVGSWASKMLHRHKESMVSKTKEGGGTKYKVVAAVGGDIVEKQWFTSNIPSHGQTEWTTISAGTLRSDANGSALCLDYSAGMGADVLLNECGSGDGSHPRDPYQRWMVGPDDAYLHAWPDKDLCLTSHSNDDARETNSTVRPMTLEKCNHSVAQSMAFGGVALGGSEGPLVTIAFGNMWLSVVNP